jgi:hypothetical protein
MRLEMIIFWFICSAIMGSPGGHFALAGVCHHAHRWKDLRIPVSSLTANEFTAVPLTLFSFLPPALNTLTHYATGLKYGVTAFEEN